MACCQAFQKRARLACLKLRPTCSTLCLPSITKLLCYFTIIPLIFFFYYSILEKYFDKLSLTTEPPYHQYTTDLNSRWKPSLPSNLTVVSIIKNNDNVELQLNSIFSQTIMPQGMIIIASKNTAKKVKHVIKENDKYSGFDVWIHVMETNKFRIIEHPYAGFVHGNMYACNILGLDHNGVHTKIVSLDWAGCETAIKI
ncbi:20434_t:CDS:2 [Entrophospora sp. SA101]|nr:20434_t:CDS:2 [Entrophospora sp. SA101]